MRRPVSPKLSNFWMTCTCLRRLHHITVKSDGSLSQNDWTKTDPEADKCSHFFQLVNCRRIDLKAKVRLWGNRIEARTREIDSPIVDEMTASHRGWIVFGPWNPTGVFVL